MRAGQQVLHGGTLTMSFFEHYLTLWVFLFIIAGILLDQVAKQCSGIATMRTVNRAIKPRTMATANHTVRFEFRSGACNTCQRAGRGEDDAVNAQDRERLDRLL